MTRKIIAMVLAVLVLAVLVMGAVVFTSKDATSALEKRIVALEVQNKQLEQRLDQRVTSLDGSIKGLEGRVQNSGILRLPEDPNKLIRDTPIENFVKGAIRSYLRDQGYVSDIVPAWSIKTDGIGTPRATSSAWGRFGSNVEIAQRLLDAGNVEAARVMTMVAIGELGVVSCGNYDIHVSTWALPDELVKLVRADLEPRYIFGSDNYGQTIGFRAKNPGC